VPPGQLVEDDETAYSHDPEESDPGLRRIGDGQGGKVAADRPLPGEGRPHPRGASPPVEQEEPRRLRDHERGQREPPQEEGPPPAHEATGRTRGAEGEPHAQERHQGHEQATRRALPSPPHPPPQDRGQHRPRHHGMGERLAPGPSREDGDPGEGEQEDGRAGQEAEGTVQQEAGRRAQRRCARLGGSGPPVDGQGRGVAVDVLKVGEVGRGHGPRDPEEDGEGATPQTQKSQKAQNTRGRDHLHVQPGRGGGQERGCPRPRRPRCAQEQAQAQGETQSGGHLGVEVEGVESHRGPDTRRPGPERRPLVPRQAERQRPNL
jgi:hypothetical protein